jgi:hypothetical protein
MKPANWVTEPATQPTSNVNVASEAKWGLLRRPIDNFSACDQDSSTSYIFDKMSKMALVLQTACGGGVTRFHHRLDLRILVYKRTRTS